MSKSSAMRLVLPIAAVGLVLVGCSEKLPGDAQGQTSTTTTERTSGTASPTSKSGSAGNGSLASLKACDLIGSAGLTDVQEKSARRCDAKYPGRVTMSIELRLDKGLADVVLGPNAQLSDTTVGSHDAKLLKKPISDQSCAVNIGVTDKSRVDVFATSDDDLHKSCDAAMAVAKALEPKLP